MQLRFWGTRGSISKAGSHTSRYGGHTSCIEVRSSNGTVIVLDCGTGAHGLGRTLVSAGQSSFRGHLLLSHTHWDHIQGIPFFEPLLAHGNEWHVYGPRSLGHSLRETLAGAMQYDYFPVTLDQLAGAAGYHDLVEGTFEIDDVRVTTRYLNHTALTLGYRLEIDGAVIVYATDHEPNSRQLATGRGALYGEDLRHGQFVAGADLLIHDSQYLAREYPAKVNWGHSTVEYVVHVAGSMGVKSLALFHHDPQRDDDAVDRLVEAANTHGIVADPSLDVFGAFEGQVVELERARPPRRLPSYTDAAVAMNAASVLFQPSVLVAVSDTKTMHMVSNAIREEGFRLLLAYDQASVLRLVQSVRPSLLILDRNLCECDGLEVLRALRGTDDPYAKEMPVILVASKDQADDLGMAADVGVTDSLIMPFSHAYTRTKIQTWVHRSALQQDKVSLREGRDARSEPLHKDVQHHYRRAI